MNLIPTIGIEMHCEMKSNTKVFSKAQNTYTEEANIHVNEVDIALPGILPTVNKECVRKAIMASLILNCNIPDYLYFDRKNYYYPDLPKGYQITQSHDPIGKNGHITVPFKNEELTVAIHDIHLEEDTAGMEHIKDASYINYNRAGIPLLELVTEPCFHSKEEVIAFLEYIRRVYQYTDISDADIMKGQIRCDVNISLSENEALGTRVEIKGVNSFSNIALVIDAEIKRQKELIENGKSDEIIQETRGFDEENNRTTRLRNKANAEDYRYFIEPNIPKIKLDSTWIEEIKQSIPVLPYERLKKYTNEYNLSITDANNLLKDKETSDYFEECLKENIKPQTACNWITGSITAYLNKEFLKITDLSLKPKDLKLIVEKLESGVISSKQAKEIVEKSFETKQKIEDLMTDDLVQISDENTLETIIDEILSKNESQITEYKNGKTNLFGFFVGNVMKQTNGKANPVKTKEILERKLK